MPTTTEPHSFPTMRCLKDIINDKHFTKFGEYSDIDITAASSFGTSASPQFIYDYTPPHPDPESPPSTPIINVVDVHPHEYDHDESMPNGVPFTAYT